MRALLLLWTIVWAPWAWAENAPAAEATAEGRRQFVLADQELNLGHYEKALEHLENAYRLTSRPALLYNLGYVNKQLFARTRNIAYLDRSIDLFKTFLETSSGPDDSKQQERRNKALKELKDAESQLAHEQAARVKGEEELALGEQFLQKGRVADAAEQLERYLRAPGNERPGVVRALVLRARIAAAGNNLAAASAAYARALTLDRSLAAPSDGSDLARRAFTQAQLRLGATPTLTVTHTPPGSLKPGAPIDLVFSSSRDALAVVRGLILHYRAGSGAFSALPVQAVGRLPLPRAWSATLLPGAKVDYYAEVVDERGAVLQHLGAPSLPFSVELERPAARPVTRKWWFWTATVGAVAAVGLSIGLGVGLSEPPRPEVPIFTGLRHQ